MKVLVQLHLPSPWKLFSSLHSLTIWSKMVTTVHLLLSIYYAQSRDPLDPAASSSCTDKDTLPTALLSCLSPLYLQTHSYPLDRLSICCSHTVPSLYQPLCSLGTALTSAPFYLDITQSCLLTWGRWDMCLYCKSITMIAKSSHRHRSSTH